jgi:hypothetical protein
MSSWGVEQMLTAQQRQVLRRLQRRAGDDVANKVQLQGV